MQAMLYNGPQDIEIFNYALPKIKDDELLVHVEACGICGTDFHIFQGKAPAKPPVILGHEFTGTITDLGKNTVNFSIGDKVVIDPNIYCGYCEYCRSGKINLCSNLKALGVTLNGGMAEYVVVPFKQAYILPKDISPQIAAFTEPLSCCIHGINRISIRPGDSITIIGAGTIGLLMIQLAKLRGASQIIVLEPSQRKSQLAQKLGADFVLNPIEENAFEDFLDFTNGGTDVVIECAGNERAAEIAVKSAKKGASVLIFGLSEQDAVLKLNLQSIFHRELTLLSSILNPFTFQKAIDLLVSGKIRVDIFNPEVLQLGAGLINLFKNKKEIDTIKYLVTPC